MATNVAIPEGFVLDKPAITQLPEGFALDKPSTLPEGFILDTSPEKPTEPTGIRAFVDRWKEGFQFIKSSTPQQTLNELRRTNTVLGRAFTETYGLAENVPSLLVGVTTFLGSMAVAVGEVARQSGDFAIPFTPYGKINFADVQKARERFFEGVEKITPEFIQPQTEAGQAYQRDIAAIFQTYEDIKELSGEQWSVWLCKPNDKQCKANVMGFLNVGSDAALILLPKVVGKVKEGRFRDILSKEDVVKVEKSVTEIAKEFEIEVKKRPKTPEELAREVETGRGIREAEAELKPPEGFVLDEPTKIEPIKPKTIPELAEVPKSEFGVSVEAVSRLKGDKIRGRKMMMLDTRTGKEHPLIGVDAIDINPKAYEVKFYRNKDGTYEVIDKGIRATAEPIELKPTPQAAPIVEPPKGFVLDAPEAGSIAFGQELPKFAESVNLERINADYPVKKLILDTSDRFRSQMETAKQGKITHEETVVRADKLSEDVRTSTKKLLKEIKGKTQDLDAYITASRNVLNSSATNLWEMQKRAVEIGTPEALDAFKNAWARHAEIQAEVGGASGKIGRALSAHRIESKLTKAYDIIQDKLKDSATTQELLDRMSKIDPLDEASLNKLVGDSVKPRFKDYIYSFWYNNILSGIPTHLVNMGSNAVWQAFQTPFRAVRATVDIPISKLQGRPREFYFKEIVPSWVGYKRGLSRGLAKGLEFMKTGKINSEITKWQLELGPNTNPFSYSPSKALRKVAPIIEAPTRALIGEDLVFKGIAFESELHALAMRKALKEGIREPQHLSKRMNELISDPTTEMIEGAAKFADYSTFTDAPGPVTETIIRLRDKVPGARLIIPFVNTISNLLKRGVEMTPGVGIILQRGARGAEISEVAAKQMLGGLITAYIAVKYVDGEITGAVPTNKNEREAFYRAGKLPWAAKFGDTWYSYRRVEPFNTVISSVAIVGDAWREKGEKPTDEVATEIVLGVGRNLLDASYLSGMSDFISAIEMGDRAPQQFIRFGARQTSGFVPYSSFWRSITRATEAETKGKAVLRKPKGAIETIKAGLPKLAEQIAPRIDIWGEQITLEGGAIRQFLPWKARTETTDFVDIEMERLKLAPGMPGKKIGGIELTDEEYQQYIVSSGKRARGMVEEFMNTSGYGEVSDAIKKLVITRQIEAARTIERTFMFKSFDIERIQTPLLEKYGIGGR